MGATPRGLDRNVDDGVAAENGRGLAACRVKRVIFFQVGVFRVFQVNRNEQYSVFSRQRAHNFFSPIAVMSVEIKYGNTFTAALKRMNGSNCHAVEYTKPAADAVLQQPLRKQLGVYGFNSRSETFLNTAVVPRGSHNTKSVLALPVQHRIHTRDDRSRSVSCSVVAAGRYERVAAFAVFGGALSRAVDPNLNARGESDGGSVAMGRFAQFAHKIDVFDVVDTGNSFD